MKLTGRHRDVLRKMAAGAWLSRHDNTKRWQLLGIDPVETGTPAELCNWLDRHFFIAFRSYMRPYTRYEITDEGRQAAEEQE